ncbi:MAG: pyrroline-5-carboxylate reductase [Actinomycetota bacterium]
MAKVAIVGGGKMGEALLGGLVHAGWNPSDLTVCEQHEDRRKVLADAYGIGCVGDIAQAVADAQTVVLAVKPQDFDGVLNELGAAIGPDCLVLSIAAGIPTRFIESRMPAGVPVVRAMPNTPALLREGVSAIAPGSHATTEHLASAAEILREVGRVVHLAEKHLDAVTGVSGTGPAYVFFLAESLIEAAVGVGLPRDVAIELSVQTLLGAARMLRETGKHPVELREEVTSPGGTTVAAMRVLEREGVRSAFLDAVRAATERSHELANEHD